jgi:molecular chaperone DnaK
MSMQRVPVGIDLGTTYSCISHLDRQGAPHTLPNPEGELATPSVVLLDGDDVIVGTEALRNAVRNPDRVIENSKRYMGDPRKAWVIDGRTHRPPDVAALILRHLLSGAEQHVGKIEHAVITVPAQFSDIQRQQTADAGLRAGLKTVDIIHEPVAAALCYVLGEGMWFAELADDQMVLVYDLGGGTFDLSLVMYNRHEVRVRASSGDLRLGGIDWNKRLETFACEQFLEQVRSDPRLDKESMQALAIEVEQTKRSLSVRQRASLTVQHAGRRKVFGIDQEHFELLTHDLVDKTEQITLKLLKDHKLGWAHVNAILITGGSSRMPMIRTMLQRIGGTTQSHTLPPDQSISHGAAYYAGMLASGGGFSKKSFLSQEATARLAKFTQQSVSARSLGILVRDKQTGERVPHYLLPANTPLPCAFRQSFGTVSEDQRRVHLHIVESGTTDDAPPVKLGACVIEDLPAGLPLATPIEVTIRYDEQARVHVSARELRSGRSARTSIVREEHLAPVPAAQPSEEEFSLIPLPGEKPAAKPAALPPKPASTFRPAESPPSPKPAAPQPPAARKGAPQPAASRKPGRPSVKPVPSAFVPQAEQSDKPIPLCDQCGESLDAKGTCTGCGAHVVLSKPAPRPKTAGTGQDSKRPAKPGAARSRTAPPPLEGADVFEIDVHNAKTERMTRPGGGRPATPRGSKRGDET